MKTKKNIRLHLILTFVLLLANFHNFGFAQINVTSAISITPQQLVQSALTGTGVTVSNVTYNGSNGPIVWNNIGSFTTGSIPSNLGFGQGVIMATGGVNGATGPNSGNVSIAVSPNTPDLGDSDLLAIAGSSVISLHDVSILEFDFVPISDTFKLRYVFGSDEYPEFVTSFNDIFGFFISGMNPNGLPYNKKNIALLPDTTTPVSIYNVNNGSTNTGPCVNCQYYVDNTGGSTIQADGMTTVLTAWALVIPYTTYHLKIAIADANDRVFDSWLFLGGNFPSNFYSIATTYAPDASKPLAIEGCNNAIVKFSIPFPKTDTVFLPLIISGTALNGIDYQHISDTICILPGHTSANLTIIPIADGITEPIETVLIKVNSPNLVTLCDSVLINIFSRSTTQLLVSNDTTICQSYSLAISVPISVTVAGIPAGMPLSYIWTPQYGLSSDIIFNPIATPYNTITYTVTVYDTIGCLNTASMTITVNEVPDIAFTAMPSTEGCTPLTVNFEDETSPMGGTRIWDFGDNTSSSLGNTSHIYQNTGYYDVTLTANNNGCTSSYTAEDLIHVYEIPPAPFISKIGDTLFANSNDGINFQWYMNDSLIIGANNISYFPSEIGYYSVTVQNMYGCFSLPSPKMLSIDKSELLAKNVLMPNPTNSFFSIKFNAIVNHIEIINTNGVLVKAYPSRNISNTYYIDELSNGMYFVKIYVDGIISMQKLIKY